MGSWIGFLIFLVLLGIVLATRGRRGVQTIGHGHQDRIGGYPELAPNMQPKTTVDSSTDIRKDPNLENSSVYHGEIFFFCSIEERDTFTANLDQFGEYHPSEMLEIPRAIDRRK